MTGYLDELLTGWVGLGRQPALHVAGADYSVEEIRATGRELRNCLTDDEPWLSALLGTVAIIASAACMGLTRGRSILR